MAGKAKAWHVKRQWLAAWRRRNKAASISENQIWRWRESGGLAAIEWRPGGIGVFPEARHRKWRNAQMKANISPRRRHHAAYQLRHQRREAAKLNEALAAMAAIGVSAWRR